MRANVSSWFIHHPIATTLICIAAVLLGLLAFVKLPVAPLPQTDFPTIQISASLPGASAETMASAVATPLETQLTGVPGISEMTSSSTLGSTSITLQFELTKNIDVAAQEVQSALNAAASRLPADMPSAPIWRKANPADTPVVTLNLQSDLLPLTELSDLAETVIGRRLSQIEGVSEVSLTGQHRPAIRIQASPARLAAAQLTLADLRTAIQDTSVNQAKGALFGATRLSSLAVNDQIFTAQDYDRLVVAYREGAPVLLSDVARVVLGSQDEYVQAWMNGRAGVGIIVRRQSDANIVATVDRILEALPSMSAALPPAAELTVLDDRTRTIRASLHEVELTLVITIALVVAVMAFFLRSYSATLIVTAVLTVVLSSTFAAMYALGFSLNNLTLVALIVAVGFIVDDVIVVIENIQRHLESGVSALDAAIRGSAEIGFTIVSISLSLIAAFIPLLFMGGIVGRLFSEFALTVTVAILISVVVCLTLAPMLASLFMREPAQHVQARPDTLSALLNAYTRSLGWALRNQGVVLIGFVATLALAVAGYVYIPKGFFPLQDTSFVFGTTQAAPDIAYADMVEKHLALAQILASDPAIEGYAHAVGATGGSQTTASGRFWIVLKPRGERDVSASGFIDRLRPALASVPGVSLSLRSGQDINIGAGAARAQYQYTLTSGDSTELARWAELFTSTLAATDEFRDVSNDQQPGASILKVNVDRVAAARFGFTTRDIDELLYNAFGQRQVSEFQTETNQYKVILEIEPRLRGTAESLDFFRLRSPLTGEMVPLLSIAAIEPLTTGPASIRHSGMSPAAFISFNLAPGVALGDAVDKLLAVREDIGMPTVVTGAFAGSAQAFRDSLATQPLLILAALIAVYIVLGVLYESFVHPLTILSTLPSAGIGAILMLWLWQEPFSIMALIGVVLLIGLVKKNGILMVDFALEMQRRESLPARDAIEQACLIRFRPILMTTLAAMLAAIPLVVGFGAGSELRRPLGIAIVGGLLLSQLLTLYSTPVIYLTLHRWMQRTRPRAAEARPAALQS